MKRRAVVRLSGERVGVLMEAESGTEFRYDREWLARADARAVSQTLPLKEEPYRSRTLHPFFENLLPEGWLLELSVAKLKVSKDDVFGLLLVVCADCIGEVEIVPESVA